jgi:hypothetical protein
MKLAILLAALLASPAIAGAETLHPPSGPVEVDDDVDMQTADNSPDVDVTPVNRGGRMDRGDRRGMGDPARRAKRQALRAALMAEFDANGDGRLGPRERQRAVRVLQRLRSS